MTSEEFAIYIIIGAAFLATIGVMLEDYLIKRNSPAAKHRRKRMADYRKYPRVNRRIL